MMNKEENDDSTRDIRNRSGIQDTVQPEMQRQKENQRYQQYELSQLAFIGCPVAWK